MEFGGAGGIRTHEWRFCRAFVLRRPISFEQVRNVLAGLLWDVWAYLGAIVQRIVQEVFDDGCNNALARRSIYGQRCLRYSPVSRVVSEMLSPWTGAAATAWNSKERRESVEGADAII